MGRRSWGERDFWDFSWPTREQVAVFGGLLAFLVWALIAAVLLVLSSELYKGPAVDEARLRYAAVGVRRMGAQAASVFSAAMAALDALDYSARQKLYFEPLDYAAIRRALQPVFLAHAALRSVDIAFIGRNASLLARRWPGKQNQDGRVTSDMLVQSNAADCFDVLGPFGCLAATPARDQPWYQLAAALPGGQEADPPNPSDGDAVDSFQWAAGPTFVRRSADTGLLASGGGVLGPRNGPAVQANVTWLPAHSLMFRIVFPGTAGQLSLVGRAVVELGGLAANGNLMDEVGLGPGGALLICDRGGSVIASPRQGEEVSIQRDTTGRVSFRHVWEMTVAWAAKLTADDFAEGRQHKTIGALQVSVAPLPGRGLGNFYAVLVAERAPFTDSTMSGLGSVAEVIVGLPVPVALTVFLGWYLHRWWKVRQMQKRVYPGDGSPPLSPGSMKAKSVRYISSRNSDASLGGIAAGRWNSMMAPTMTKAMLPKLSTVSEVERELGRERERERKVK